MKIQHTTVLVALVKESELSTRAKNCIRNHFVVDKSTVGDLIKDISSGKFRLRRNVGNKVLKEICAELGIPKPLTPEESRVAAMAADAARDLRAQGYEEDECLEIFKALERLGYKLIRRCR